MPSVVTASTSKTMQKVRGVPPVVDASTSKTQQEDTGLSRTSATNDPRSQQHRRPTSISKCNRKNCLTCPIFKPETMFRSSVTGKTYKVIGSGDWSCSTSNVVYLVTCQCCGLQYVGETSQALRKRMNNHRANIKSLKPQFLYKHFTSDGHKLEDMFVQPIESIVVSPNEQASTYSKRLEREEFWIRELKTVYPYGLNDNIRGVGNISKQNDELIVWKFFNKHSKTRNRKSKRPSRKNTKNPINPRDWLKNKLGNYKSMCFLHKYISTVFGLRNTFLRDTRKLVEEQLHLHTFPTHLLLILKDLIKFRLGTSQPQPQPLKQHTKENNRKHFLKVKFHNKGIEMINLNGILHSRWVKATIPVFFEHNEPPTVSYKYTKTIGPSVFNFRKVTKSINLSSNDCTTCKCSSSAFVYQPLGHVVTGDLSIITNRKLRRLIKKGPNFREQNNINWDLCLKLCMEGVNNYRDTWASREGVDPCTLNEWAGTVKLLIENNINRLKSRGHKTKKRQVLKDTRCRTALQELHNEYVLVPADKASNNIIIVCKKYYSEVIRNELAGKSGKASTYIHCRDSVDQIVQKHLAYMHSTKIKVAEDMKRLPGFYWMPKLHKNPYGHRFIAASASCTTKPLSKLLTHCLQLILKHYKEYCKGIERRTGVNCFWVINNSIEVTNTLDKLRHARALDSFDFSTLYTNIPHSQLKTRMEELIRNAFNTRDASHMALGKDYAYWTSRHVANSRNLTVNQLVEMFNFLIDNIYIQIGSAVYQQTIGIPMGTDCAPLVADLFLFSYEFEFMKSLIRTDLSVAAKFNNTCRYIDDLLTLNNPDFQACIGQIYLPELELKKTTESHDSCSYLDLNINILNGKFYTDLYDKRDTFSFSIVNFPHMDSNIPSKPAYGVAISQLVRYLRICCNYTKILLTDLNYSQPDYLDRDTYTKNSAAPTRPLCIATP